MNLKLTYDLDIVGHPAEEDRLLNSSFPSVSTEQGVILEHHGELGEATEEQGGQGGGQEGQVTAEEPFHAWVLFLALENLWKQIFCLKYSQQQFHLCAVLQKHCPIDAVDDVADEQQEDRGNEQVVEDEPLQDQSIETNIYY